MTILIKADDMDEFKLAEANGCVFGVRILQATLYAYVDLGASKVCRIYYERKFENVKCFSNSTVFYAETKEKRNNESYINETFCPEVIIYY